MERNNFFIVKTPDKPQLPGWYQIRLKVQTFPDPRLVTDGSICISGWQYEAHAERYLSEFTETELAELERLEYAMWEASPEGAERSPRHKLSSQIERLKRTVQRRCGPELKDS